MKFMRRADPNRSERFAPWGSPLRKSRVIHTAGLSLAVVGLVHQFLWTSQTEIRTPVPDLPLTLIMSDPGPARDPPVPTSVPTPLLTL